MGKVPRAGRVKTRLTRRLTPDQAAQLYAAFLADTFRLVERAAAAAGDPPWGRVFACALAEGESIETARGLAPAGWTVVAQAGAGLGARIEHARASGAADHVVVMGSDSPTLPEDRLHEAFSAMASAEGATAIVPTEDGGYALIGFSAARPALLTDIPWSTEGVMDATRAAAEGAGLCLVELPFAYDVDQPEDLDRLRNDVDPQRHPATRSALASLR